MGVLEGKIAVITGASSGIGKRTAEVFVEQGASVVLAARRADALAKVAEALTAAGGAVLTVAADVGVQEDCARLIEETVSRFGRIDILVNNAGMADKHRPITRCDADWWARICQVNLDSVFYLTKAALVYMEKQGKGSIVNISSIGGTNANSGVAYSASKAGVIALTRNVAIQFAESNIRCNAVCPGPTPTALNTPEQIATFDGEFAAQCAKYFNTDVPEADVTDQANAITFFASDLSKAVTGQTLIVGHGCVI